MTVEKIREIIFDMSENIETFPIRDIAKIIADYVYELPTKLVKKIDIENQIVQIIELKNGCILGVMHTNPSKIWDKNGNNPENISMDNPFAQILELKNKDILLNGGWWNAGLEAYNIKTETHVPIERVVYTMIALNGGGCAYTNEHVIKIWDEKQVGILSGHTKYISKIMQLQDGCIVSGSADNTVKIWDLEKLTCLLTFAEHKETIRDIIELKNGNIASVSNDNIVIIWTRKGTCLKKIKVNLNSPVTEMSELIDDCLIFNCPGQYKIIVLDILTGEVLKSFNFIYDSGSYLELDDGHLLIQLMNSVKIYGGRRDRFSEISSIEVDGLTSNSSILKLKNGCLAITTDVPTVNIYG